MLDQASAKLPGARLYVPGLAEAAGDAKRADVERRRYDMLMAGATRPG
jgi:hypothetical protein